MNRITAKVDTKVLVGVLVALTLVVGIAAVARLDVLGKKGGGLGKDFKYDVKEMAYIDPNLILYEESGQAVKTGFAAARAIAVDSKGSVYVAGDTSIRIFAASGDLLGEIKLAGTPTCLTITDDSTVYVGLQDHVEVYDPRGQRQARWGDLGQDAILTSIVVSRGNVLVADAGNRVVVRYDLAGKVLNHIGEKDPERNVPGFIIPSPYFDLAVPRDGLLRVVNTGRRRIESYTFDGDFEFCGFVKKYGNGPSVLLMVRSGGFAAVPETLRISP